MATKAHFTEPEWATMHRGVTGAGMLVSMADPGFTDSFGESSAMAKYLAGQRAAGATELTRELAAMRGTGFGVTSKPEEVRRETMAALEASVATLQAKAPEDVASYRDLVIGLSIEVAEAKSGVKPSETAAIDAIKEALGAV
jgi:hypothetical protein